MRLQLCNILFVIHDVFIKAKQVYAISIQIILIDLLIDVLLKIFEEKQSEIRFILYVGTIKVIIIIIAILAIITLVLFWRTLNLV